MKVYNHRTGEWFVIGQGFVTDCMWKASKLTEEQTQKVERQYAKDPYVNRIDVPEGQEGDCGCDECNPIDADAFG